MAATQHKPTLRVLDILETLSTYNDQGLTLTEISEKINVPKSTIVPIIHTLLDKKFIAHNGSGRYIIGIKTLLIGSASLQNFDVLDLFKEEMKRIVTKTGEICQLGILSDGDVLYLAKEESPEPIRLISFVGKRLPAYSTALGKALLSDFSLAELQALYPHPLTAITPKTCTSLDKLFDECSRSKKNGYFQEKEEISPDLNCFAVPIFYKDKIVSAISVSIPTFRLSPEKAELVIQTLLTAKQRLESNISRLGIADSNLFINSFFSHVHE